MALAPAELVMAAKRMIRPLIPDVVMARLRRPDHSDRARVNVDLVFDTPGAAPRWLQATPDTYRARVPETFPGPEPEAHFLRPGDPIPARDGIVAFALRALTDHERRLLLLPLSDPGIDCSVVAYTRVPKVARNAVFEPELVPIAVAIDRPLLESVGGLADGDRTLAGLVGRLRQAGLRFALIPKRPTGNWAGTARKVDPLGPAIVIFAPVPMHDVGGGFRGAQMALELIRAGFHVSYVALYGSSESTDLGLRFVHPKLEQSRLDEFDAAELLDRVQDPRRLVINQIPAAPIVEPISKLKAGGFGVAYDLIDDWSDNALGGWWWKPEIEAANIDLADTLVASAPSLGARLERLSGRLATLIPNGVNPAIFDGSRSPRPPDLPSSTGALLLYHGSLYGDWFDWGTLDRVAGAYPDAVIALIGDPRGHPPVAENVRLLGLKPQMELPAYLAQADVSIIPFKVNATTHAVSPLKAFEALAMGVPVAAPPLEPLAGLEGVHTAPDLVEAIAVALGATRPDGMQARRSHGWEERVSRLLAAAGIEPPDQGSAPVELLVRPVVHHQLRLLVPGPGQSEQREREE